VKIAVVIPAVDEARNIPGAVESAAASDVDVVVVDGGSRDGTPECARSAGARVLESERGRARQLRAGVRATEGETVLLLHADTRLSPGWKEAVEDALRDPGVVAGAFRLRFEDRGLAFRVLEWGVRLRVAVLGLPYGDQALFVRRGVLDELGGIPQVDFMEDLDLVSALKRRGRLRVLPLPVTTSGRRYRQAGVLRTTGLHLLAALLWSLGVDRARIKRWVRG
jgi:rSAM/selenodomain-associated transferase 2